MLNCLKRLENSRTNIYQNTLMQRHHLRLRKFTDHKSMDVERVFWLNITASVLWLFYCSLSVVVGGIGLDGLFLGLVTLFLCRNLIWQTWVWVDTPGTVCQWILVYWWRWWCYGHFYFYGLLLRSPLGSIPGTVQVSATTGFKPKGVVFIVIWRFERRSACTTKSLRLS